MTHDPPLEELLSPFGHDSRFPATAGNEMEADNPSGL
jgi:hypothetical protein